MTREEIQLLADRVASGMATPEELLTFQRLFAVAQSLEELRDEQLPGDREALQEQMKQVIWHRAGLHKPRIFWIRWTAAAAIMAVALAGSYLLLVRHPAPQQAKRMLPKGQYHNDVIPGHNGAVLTLSNGRQIVLDSAQNGSIAEESNATLTKKGGEIIYNAHSQGSELLYNTMTTPRGRQYSLVLSDGTKVWLNAASSISYPTAFAGKERRVMITGEAYFEVAHNRSMPFIVQKGNIGVQVLGTNFNVNGYEDEPLFKVTLLEGSVRVQNPNGSEIIKPGQQAQISPKGAVSRTGGIDVEEVMAWKNGTFLFNGKELPAIMRQLSRWYDVEVVYQKRTDDLFYAEIPINTKLSDVLKALELTGKVHFDIDGRKIIVLQ